MQKKSHSIGLALLLLSIAAMAPAAEPEKKATRETQNRKAPDTRKETSCTGEVYSSCICPGHKVVCQNADGEYENPAGQCDNPVDVTAVNIDNLVGCLQLIDPPCTQPRLCRRVSVNDSSSAPQKHPECRCREKVAVCRRIFY